MGHTVLQLTVSLVTKFW